MAVPQPLTWRRRFVAGLAIALLRVSLKTWRCRWVEAPEYQGSAGPVIYCMWHNRLPLSLACVKYMMSKFPAAGLAGMISASRDGSLLASVAEAFGVQPIRGSTSRRGPQALLEATTWIDRNYSITITPDGPRGPAYEPKIGIIVLAQLSGRPIIPVGMYTPWKIRLKSWDRFQIPLPFARCELRQGEPIWVPREAGDEEREQLRLRLQETMRRLMRD